MMKSGATQLRRLTALVLTLALLLTAWAVPALALEGWDDLTLSVTWTDAAGNVWPVPAWSVPDDQVTPG